MWFLFGVGLERHLKAHKHVEPIQWDCQGNLGS